MFLRWKHRGPQLDRATSLSAKPVLNQLVKVERDAAGNVLLNIPRRRTALVRVVSKVFKLPPFRRVALDQLGTYVISHCDGQHKVSEIIGGLAAEFQITKREAEVSLLKYLQTLAKRGIIGLAIVENQDLQQSN